MIRNTYGSANEMTRYIHNLTLWYIRGIRAYHLKNRYEEDEDQDQIKEEEKSDAKLHEEGPVDASDKEEKPVRKEPKGPRVYRHGDLAACFRSLLEFLVNSRQSRIKYLLEMHDACTILIAHLTRKGSSDENLKDDRLFHTSVKALNSEFKTFKDQVFLIKQRIDDRHMEHHQNQIKISQDYKVLRHDYNKARTMMSLINAVAEHNHVWLQQMPLHQRRLLESMKILGGMPAFDNS